MASLWLEEAPVTTTLGGLLGHLLGGLPSGIEYPQTRVARCGKCFLEIEEALEYCRREVPGTSWEEQACLLVPAVKRARALDCEATALLQVLLQASDFSTRRSADALVREHHKAQRALRELEEMARPFIKAPLHGPYGGAVSEAHSLAQTLRARLEDLSAALDAWESVAGKNEATTLARVSSSFEDFRASLSRGGDNRTAQGVALLRALPGAGPWGDPHRVQGLLVRRQAFLLRHMECGRDFLERVRCKETWPEAEKLEACWCAALREALGRLGAADWRERAEKLEKRRQRHQKQRGICASSSVWSRSSSRPFLAEDGVLRVGHMKASHLRQDEASSAYVALDFGGQHVCTRAVPFARDGPDWHGEEAIFEVDSLRATPLLGMAVRSRRSDLNVDVTLGRVEERGLGVNVLALLSGAEAVETVLDLAAPRVERTRRRVCRLPLQGVSAGEVGALLEFELAFVEGGSADPLLLHPCQDEALALVAQVESGRRAFRATFGPESQGFFLPPVESEARLALERWRACHIPPEIVRHVNEYNCMLDELSAIAAEALSRLSGDPAFAATRGSPRSPSASVWRVAELCARLRALERRVAGDPLHWVAIAFQDALLPSVARWSTDRRRMLRDQVFLMVLYVRRVDLCGMPPAVWQPCVLAVALFIGAVICLLAVVHDWAHRRLLVWTVACVALVCVTVALYSCRRPGALAKVHGSGPVYSRLPVDDTCEL